MNDVCGLLRGCDLIIKGLKNKYIQTFLSAFVHEAAMATVYGLLYEVLSFNELICFPDMRNEMDDGVAFWFEDCDGPECPPPVFNLPPPPQPPSIHGSCLGSEDESHHPLGLAASLHFDDVCDNFLLAQTTVSDGREPNFILYLIVIVICSIGLVSLILAVTAIVWRYEATKLYL